MVSGGVTAGATVTVDVLVYLGGDILLEFVILAGKYQYEVSRVGMLNMSERGQGPYLAMEVLTLQ